MAIHITDDGSNIKLELTTEYSREGYNKIPAQIAFLSKEELDIKTIDQDIIIYDKGNSYRFLYSDITVPSPATYTTPSAMIGAIDALKESGTSEALEAGEAHIGQVGGEAAVVGVTPTISTGIYAANDNIGGMQTLTNAMRTSGGTAYLMSVVIQNKDNEKAAMEGYIFNAVPGGGTYTDNAPMVIGATDLLKCVGKIEVAAGDYKTVGGVAVAEVDVKRLYMAVGSRNLYVCWRVTGTPTFTSTSDLSYVYKFDQN